MSKKDKKVKKVKKVKSKKNKGYIVGCVALAVLLGLSTYISLVVVGVVADENRNGGNQQIVALEGDSGNQNISSDEPATESGGFQSIFGGNSNKSEPNNNSSANNVQSNATKPQVGSTMLKYYLSEKKTKKDIVEIYATVMNNAKAKKPGFTKIEYQELPSDPANRVISEGTEAAGDDAVNKMLDFLQGRGVFIPKEQAEKEPYIHKKGDANMNRFPVFDRAKGSYLTDPNGIESFKYSVQKNGNVKFSFVLVPEDGPEPIGENTNVAPSYTGAVFSPMSKAKIDNTVYHPIVAVFAKNIKYSLRYHDCSVEVEFNPETLELVYLRQIARVSIKGSGDVIGAGHIGLERQELIGTVIVKDLSY